MDLKSFSNFIFALVLLVTMVGAEENILPNQVDLKLPLSYEQMVSFLEKVDKKEHIAVTSEGSSLEGRFLYLVHAWSNSSQPRIPLFFFGQQHGNEPAGKDALLYLLQDVAEDPHLLPPDIDLWIMPLVNPDGASKDQRRNANGADLNRDHQLLSQPETQILHQTFRKIRPLIAVDCHEFARDSKDYLQKGWIEWPQIMMDCCNHPLFNSKIYDLGMRYCEEVAEPLAKAGHNYTHYFVGGTPPEEEQRHSTPELDDARNGLAAYGGLTFIIESGLYRDSENVHTDLAQRVDAYLILLKQLISKSSKNSELINLVRTSRKEKIPAFIPTNYFWANAGNKPRLVKVISSQSRETIEIPTMNFMSDLVVKKSVISPKAYLIEEKNAQPFKRLFDRHDIQYSILKEPAEYLVQGCKLIRFEDFRDSLYNRYENRQIVEPMNAEKRSFPPNSLVVALDQKAGKRAALLLEPQMLYGLYQYEEFKNLIGPEGIVPVWRLLE